MTIIIRSDQPSTHTVSTKTPWVAPVVQTIAAGQAEVGTRARGDGAFTTS